MLCLNEMITYLYFFLNKCLLVVHPGINTIFYYDLLEMSKFFPEKHEIDMSFKYFIMTKYKFKFCLPHCSCKEYKFSWNIF